MKTVKCIRNISFKNRKPTSDEFKIDISKYKERINLEVTINFIDSNQKGTYYFQDLDIKSKSMHCYIKPGELIDKLKWSPVNPDKSYVNNLPIIFFRIAWMKYYSGVNLEDVPSGGGKYIGLNNDGGEVYNFLPLNGYYYGYASPPKDNDLNLERLKSPVSNNQVQNVTVILFAKHPLGGSYIVGWYKNATLNRNTIRLTYKKRKDKPFYLFSAKVNDCTLVPENKRVFQMPKDGPGQSNVWYGAEYSKKDFIPSVLSYINKPEDYLTKIKGKKVKQPMWQVDAEKRKKVELAAMELTAEYYTQLGFDVYDVHEKNYGWDMEARKGKEKLLLEVKGLSGNELTVELSANEYAKSKKHKKDFRICIVNNALDKNKKQLHVFANIKGYWISNNGLWLNETPKVSAIFSLKA
jgi:hypothetical protein